MRSRFLLAGSFAAAVGCIPPAPALRPYSDTAELVEVATAPPPRTDDREIRSVQAPMIREVSAAGLERAATRADLPATHRLPPVAAAPTLRGVADLRLLVGRRDVRPAPLVAIEWARQLGATLEADDLEDVLAWAERTHRLQEPATAATVKPGDLLAFERTESDADIDRLAIVLGRDARGVVEFLYLGGGVVRRGYVDIARPDQKRDAEQRIVNTFLRHGRRWPPKGTRYLAGELLRAVIRL